MVDVLVSVTDSFKQILLSAVKEATGLGKTSIVFVIDCTQPPVVVKVYVIVCVPAPAMEGSNIPLEVVPGPVYTPVPDTPFVTTAEAMEEGEAPGFRQTPAKGG